MNDYIFCPRCSAKLIENKEENLMVKKCSKCEFIFWNNPAPAVTVLIHKDNKVLMLQRAHDPHIDYWVMPGGFLRYDEEPEKAIKREAKEETGLEIKIGGLVGIYRIDNDPRGIHTDIIYHAEANGTSLISDEDKNLKYFLPDNLPEKIAYKHREAIEDWFTKGGKYG